MGRFHDYLGTVCNQSRPQVTNLSVASSAMTKGKSDGNKAHRSTFADLVTKVSGWVGAWVLVGAVGVLVCGLWERCVPG